MQNTVPELDRMPGPIEALVVKFNKTDNTVDVQPTKSDGSEDDAWPIIPDVRLATLLGSVDGKSVATFDLAARSVVAVDFFMGDINRPFVSAVFSVPDADPSDYVWRFRVNDGEVGMRNDGTISMIGDVTIDGDLDVQGGVDVTGPIDATGSIASEATVSGLEVEDATGTLSGLRSNYNLHTHVSAAPGSPTSIPTPTDP